MRRTYALLLLTTGVALELSAQVPATAATSVRGIVVDAGGPVPGADVRLLRSKPDRTHLATSDSAGGFEFRDVTAGAWTLVVRRIGYQAHAQPLVVDERDEVIIGQIRLTAVAQSMDTVAVVEASVVPARYGSSSRMHEFYTRRARGRGRFFTRDDIEASGRSKLADLLRQVPGVRVKILPGDLVELSFARCSIGRLQGSIDPTPRSPVRGQPSQLAFYYNGVPVDTATGRRQIAELDLGELEAIEVYRGVSELPLEAMGDTCAAIFVWTRFGPGS
jgi:hypothetical protein